MRKTMAILLIAAIGICAGCSTVADSKNQPPIAAASSIDQIAASSNLQTNLVEKEEYLASFEGKFPRDEGTYNAGVAAMILNGHIVKSGETFSFNQAVGERTPDKGFHKAWLPYYDKNGNLAWMYDYGTGICRISDVIETVRQLAGLKWVETHPHNITPAYFAYNPGLADATIFWDGGIDNKFQNDKNHDIKIKSWVYSKDGDHNYLYLYVEFDKVTYVYQ